jgi:predicted lipoprotein with Yx(FWY)xxD motif
MSKTMTRAAAWTAALLMSLSAVLAGTAGATAKPMVSTVHNARLHATILVNSAGRTLYHLSVEHKGHFICIDKTCLSFWHPLLVPNGTKATGRVSLTTVRRPNGTLQVAYRGEPLYTFVQDTKRGDVKGEGFKDVGVWHAAKTGAAATTATATTATATSTTTTSTTTTTTGGGYGYGG